MSDNLIGRTIAAVEDCGYDGFELIFTDGTRAVIEGEGYDTSAARVGLLDHAALRRRAAERQGDREAERVSRLRTAALRAEVESMRADLPPAAFDRWMDANRRGWRTAKMMSDIMRESYADMMRDQRRAVNRQFYGNVAATPIAES